ncbi:MAG: HipA N-terminal domain-containing protein [Bacteroidetes bacterium]|nr:HipA N-terminal domain-containing protein [Bacteroidota bacterium]
MSAAAYRRATVWVDDREAGLLEETDRGYRFTYHPAYLQREGARAVSLTLPLAQEAYTANTLFPFFDGLIPEGWLLEVATRHWKADPRDRFGLLLAYCADCIGNVSLKPADHGG